MPLTTLTINTQENHCVRHSIGSYQSQEISHTDIHSHARTHVRDCMHCFGKFWSHDTSVFSSTSCNWQPCLAPHDITQGHLKWERGKEEKEMGVTVLKCIQSKGGAVFEKFTSIWKLVANESKQCKAELQIIKHNYSRNLSTFTQAIVSLKKKIDSWAAG